MIEDNATGISTKKAQSLLTNIAQSTKDRYSDKGFRGIGRLGGLAYCDKLIFETAFKNEPNKSKMVWDAKQLRRIINDATYNIEAAELISVITDFSKERNKEGDHFFKVKMENVSRDELLEEGLVREYLSMVAPVPLPKTFSFSEKIYAEAKKSGIEFDEYEITLNETTLTKGYKDSIFKDGEITDKIIDIEFMQSPNDSKDLLFWGWYGISEKMQQIPPENTERFLRLRKANIQIGLDNRLDEFHKEATGNNYFIGEIHAMARDLVPNARRDFFVDSPTTSAFKTDLKDLFQSVLYKLYYDFSKKNSSIKTLEEADKMNVGEGNKLTGEEQVRFEKKVEKAIKDINTLQVKYKDKALGKLIKEKASTYIDKRPLDSQGKKKDTGSNKQAHSAPKSLQNGEQTLVERIFKVIRDNLEKKAAEQLISKIKEIL